VAGLRLTCAARPTFALIPKTQTAIAWIFRMFGEMVRVEFEPTINEGTRHFIVNGVDNYNVAVTSLPDYFPVNFVLRDQRGGVLGGVLGQLWGGWLHVTYLWVTKKARGLGHGTRLMQNAEAYAHSRGAVGATLETHSFQARPFYERLGYEVFSTLDGYPLGHAKYFLKKTLA
jgi:ribosomal protein S18 acetylase RimI-like enzyme